MSYFISYEIIYSNESCEFEDRKENCIIPKEEITIKDTKSLRDLEGKIECLITQEECPEAIENALSYCNIKILNITKL